MKCPFCNNYFTIVVDSREVENGTKVRRRRECTKCDKKFSTYESIISDEEDRKIRGVRNNIKIT